ncbi:MAG: DUF115 domain-containing protein [Chloroflexi bacterium]|nr:DUF115 domain-containing protein [Chloroflexota bacterium]
MNKENAHSLKRRLAQGLLGQDRYLALREASYRYTQVRTTLDLDKGYAARAIRDDRLVNSRHRLERLRDTHKGQRCFVVGNGPSLNKTDLSRLRNEAWFGANRIYLMEEKLGFSPTYFVCVNELVLRQCAEDIRKLSMPKFLSVNASADVDLPHDSIFLNTIGGRARFGYEPTQALWESGTVTYVSMQLAFYMGFKEVVLIGVDHSFSTRGPANTEVESQGDDPNHFSLDYFGKGFKWHLPDLESSERGYRLARAAFEAEGRRIVDATVGGKLTIFPKVEFGDLFDQQ